MIWACRLGFVAALAAFVSLAVARAIQDGVCCGDDALFAVAAKDVARGRGYPEGGDLDRERSYFGLPDARLSVGPVLVLPVAAAIRVLGNRHWVPGVASIALWSILFVSVIGALRPFGDAGRRYVAAVLFLALCYSFCAWHFEQWYAMLGEVPTSLLIWLAAAVWAARPRRRLNLSVASLLIGLACLTKLMAALCVPPFLAGVAMARGWRGRTRLRQAFRDVLASLAWTLLPAVLFQGYRALAAGPRQYLAENRQWLAFALAQATAEQDSPGVLARASAYSRQAYERFGLGPSELLLLSTVALLVIASRARPTLRLQALVLLGCVMTNVAWWLLASKGRPRHLLIALVLTVAAAVLPLLALRQPARALSYCLLLATCTAPNWARASHPLRHGPDGWFSPSAAVRNALAVAARVDAAPPGMPVFGQWWATIADLEYLSADVGRYGRLPDGAAPDAPAQYAIASNARFQSKPDPAFEKRLASCRREEMDRLPYELFWCGASEPSPPPR